MGRKKLALLLGQAEEGYQNSFIDGVMKQAFNYDYDVCVFSMYIKFQNNKEREVGDSNIFNLINYDIFDGVIVLSDTIQTPGVVDDIEETIHEKFNGPVVCVDKDCEYFHSFWTDGYNDVYATISHMIEKHGLKDIAYLTGRKHHKHSQRRLAAYKAAMRDHGLEVRDDRIFYGDFWYTSGTGCAEILLRKREDLPEAVVCANDCMAIGVANEMVSAGLRIPEDIAIAGYGITEEGVCSPKSLTSTYVPAEYYGAHSVESVMKLLKGEKPDEPNPEAKLFIGESCGCDGTYEEDLSKKRTTWMTDESEEGFYSIHNTMLEDMLLAGNLKDLFNTVYEHISYLRGVKSFDICLNEEWMDDSKLMKNAFPVRGYSEKSINMLSYCTYDSFNCRVGDDRVFKTDELFPHEYDNSEPACYLFVPLFFEDKSFGYAIISYGMETGKIDEASRHIMHLISGGLESYRRQHIISMIELKETHSSEKKFPTFMYTDEQIKTGIERLNDEEKEELEIVSDILDHNRLKYHFQPIVNAIDGEIYSYEALMRSDTEKTVSPLSIIKMADLLDRLNDVEKDTFINVLTLVGEHKDIFGKRKVFINSIPGCRVEGEDGEKINSLLNKYSDCTVVELTEQAELEDKDLDELKEGYKKLGIRIAVDDYGTGYSNVGNLLRYMPNYVKIDRSLIEEIQNSSQKQHFVREIIEFCHSNDIMALAEGVETVEELSYVIRLGVDLIQGFYLAKPSPEVITSIDSNKRMEITRFHREREEGLKESDYVAGRTNRISINNLVKSGKSTIVIGAKDVTFRDITIVGTPNMETNIHIEVLEGYDGRLTLENVNFSSVKNRPCIDMADNCNMTLSLVGENRFNGGGIKVPETSKLSFDGDGNLKINQSGPETYGIGNASDKAHGAIEFYQDGEIIIESNGQLVIGIGSGLGGEIKICKGKYTIAVTGDDGVGVGSLYGNQPIILHDCDFMADCSFHRGVCVGNVNDSVSIEMWHSLIRCTGSGRIISLIGTVDGKNAEIKLSDLSYLCNVRADRSTGVGSLNGSSVIDIDTAAYKYKAVGKEALIYGGFNDDLEVVISNCDITIDLVSDSGKIVYGSEEKIKEDYTLKDIRINGEVVV